MNEKSFLTLSTRKVFLKMAIPGLLSMFFSSIGMIVDGIFVGRFVGETALAAVNLIMPIFMILFAVGDMIAVGSSVKISIKLGEEKNEDASSLFTASLVLLCIIGFLVMIGGLIFGKSIIFFVIKDVTLAELSYKYANVFILGIPFIMPMFVLDNYLRICGKQQLSMSLNIISVILNAVLNLVFLGIFNLGIEFSAISTVLSMVFSTIVSFIPFLTNKLTLKLCKPKLSFIDFKGIVANGSSEFFSNISGSFMSLIINGTILYMGGKEAVTAYSIAMYIDTVIIAMLFGLQTSIQPVVSYNVGAKRMDRVFSLFKISCISCILISVFFMSIMFLIPNTLVGLFINTSNETVINTAVTILMLSIGAYIFNWFNITVSSFVTGFDKPKESLIIMILNTVVFPLVSITIIPNLIGINGVYLTNFISELLTFVVAIIIWKKLYNKLKTE